MLFLLCRLSGERAAITLQSPIKFEFISLKTTKLIGLDGLGFWQQRAHEAHVRASRVPGHRRASIRLDARGHRVAMAIIFRLRFTERALAA
jgi:hypothetical protein